jgi:predicted lipoprotein with Yx(FWY)xxD motif
MNGISIGRKVAVGVCVAGLVGAGVTGIAGGKTPSITLKARSTASLGKVLAAPNSFTLYRLAPETSHSLLCTTAKCLRIWKPLLVRSKTTTVKLPAGISGTVGFVKRGTKFQVALSSHPLYTFDSDGRPGDTNGEGIKSFGGTWHVLKVRTPKKTTTPAPNPNPGYGPY